MDYQIDDYRPGNPGEIGILVARWTGWCSGCNTSIRIRLSPRALLVTKLKALIPKTVVWCCAPGKCVRQDYFRCGQLWRRCVKDVLRNVMAVISPVSENCWRNRNAERSGWKWWKASKLPKKAFMGGYSLRMINSRWKSKQKKKGSGHTKKDSAWIIVSIILIGILFYSSILKKCLLFWQLFP